MWKNNADGDDNNISDEEDEVEADAKKIAESAASADKERLELLRRTQHELNQIYSTTESIRDSAASSSRLSSELSQHSRQLTSASFHRNSVNISIQPNQASSGSMSDLNSGSQQSRSHQLLHDSACSTEASQLSSPRPVTLNENMLQGQFIRFSDLRFRVSASSCHTVFVLNALTDLLLLIYFRHDERVRRFGSGGRIKLQPRCRATETGE